MAPMELKFCLSTWRLAVVSSAAFILLSVASAEERRCYWCGPLAEQIHRSRRAPSCYAPEENVTTCEAGLSHCAMVATSPPFVESRYCVKFYQDECYPLFCNSTKTWRMTCPCRGDLCNGQKTERENEAFAILSKLVAKTQNIRLKRTLVTPRPFITKRSDPSNIENGKAQNNPSEVDGQQLDRKNENNINISRSDGNIETDKEINETNIFEEKNVNAPNIEVITPYLEDQTQKNYSSVNTTRSDINREMGNNDLNSDEKMPGASSQSMDIKAVKEVEHTTSPATTTQMNDHGGTLIPNDSKQRETLPTAEALQQNVSPLVVSEKPQSAIAITTTDATTMATTLMDDMKTTTETTEMKRNHAMRMGIHVFTFHSIILSFVL